MAALAGAAASHQRFKGGVAVLSSNLSARLRVHFGKRAPLSRLAFGGLLGFAVCVPFSISLAQICVFTAIAAWLASIVREAPSRTLKLPLWKPWLLFALLTLASALHSAAPVESLVKTRELTQILIFYLAMNVLEDEREALWLLRLLLIAVGVAASYALFASLQALGPSMNRGAGFFSNPMTFGGFLLVVGLLPLSYAFTLGWRRAGVGIWLVISLIVAALAVSLCRHAWVGFAVGVVVIAAANKSREAVLFLILLVLLVAFMAPQPMRQRAKNILNPWEESAAERLYMWESGFRMWMDKKFLGVGPAQIKRNFAPYANPGARVKARGHLHNNLMNLAAERGALTLAAWIWLWIGYFVLVIRRLRHARDGPFVARFRIVSGLAVAAGFLSAGMFEYNFGDSEVVMTAFLALALPFAGNAGNAGEADEALCSSLA